MSDQPLRTVRVPEPMAPLFQRAEEVVSAYFAERRDCPEQGSLEIFGQRYVLVRAASLSVEFFQLVQELYGPGREQEAEAFTRNILFDLAHAIGKSDARNFHAKMGLQDPIARLSAGPIHFAHTGWAFVDIFPESNPAPGPDFYLLYDHPYSFESEAWLQAGKRRDFPACIMNAGYSSGWCEESFGLKLVASEILCRAKGDECCRFVMATPERIEGFVEGYRATVPHLSGRMEGYQIPDFFARKRLEEALRESRDELERRVELRTRELRDAKEQLEMEMRERAEIEAQLRQTQKMEAIGRLAGGVAHDFNNLLTAILGYTTLALRQEDESSRTWNYLQEVRKASERAAGLTQQLLAFSRQQVLEPRALDLNQVILDLSELLRSLLGEGIELELDLAPGIGPVKADPGQMEQVLLNLTTNARDAMPDGGRLTLKTHPLQGLDARGATRPQVQLLVRDTGAGMDEETLGRVFEPFFTTKARGKGTGLGLATVYGIVRQSGGTIAVTSEPGEGTAFILTLPCAEGAPAPAPAPDPAPEAEGHARGTVMLVEDEDAVRSLLARVLEDQGYRVLAAEDPLAALALDEGLPAAPDLLLTDVVMPHMSGRALAERLQARRPGLRVLYMSGYTDRILEGQDLEPGTFIQKPCAPDVVLERVRKAIQGG